MRSADAPGSVTKQDLRTAYDAIDQWIEDNGATINQAFPVGIRAQLNQVDKLTIFAAVLMERRKIVLAAKEAAR